jgi:uncharacterized protein YkwD
MFNCDALAERCCTFRDSRSHPPGFYRSRMSFIRHPPRSLAAFAAVLVLAFSLADLAFARELSPLAGKAPTRYGNFLAPASACPNQTEVRAAFAEQMEAMRCLVNWARRRVGLQTLRHSAVLDRSSRLKAVAINRCHDFSHTACGQPFAWAFERAGYLGGRSWQVGENIAAGQGSFGSPRGALVAWLNSSGHRHNLLAPAWRDLGVALLRSRGILGLPTAMVWVSQFGWRG